MAKFKRVLMHSFVVIAIAVMAPLAASGSAVAAPVTGNSVAAQACGWLGGETYNHCGNTYVILRATDFWGTDYYPCVGPGETHLGHLSTWVIRYAVYIGRTC
ncbi:DUF6355 family natural product biosynthesis protein [Plantactinospora sp. WMMB782]|uniref:DUF6355 family natural product biosynthesis protein n=1 Tax=Plantactinospora sp. WMMB782 TaxID=3404121 RepID=UPI003B9602D5